jgi:hypothetical protein
VRVRGNVDIKKGSDKTWHIIQGKGDGSEGIWLVLDRSILGNVLFHAFEKYGRGQRIFEKDVLLLRDDFVQTAAHMEMSPFESNLENPISAVIVTVEGDKNLLGAIDRVDLEYTSWTGALPNLDLIACFQKIAQEQKLAITTPTKSSLHPLLGSIQKRFGASPVLSRLIEAQVDCIHLRVTMRRDWRGVALHDDVRHLYRALESTLHSLNSLEERLHQSYFFYILTSMDSFLPISHYSIILAMWIAGFVILWLASGPHIAVLEADSLARYVERTFLWNVSPYCVVYTISYQEPSKGDTLLWGLFIVQVIFCVALEDVVTGMLAALAAVGYTAFKYCTMRWKISK